MQNGWSKEQLIYQAVLLFNVMEKNKLKTIIIAEAGVNHNGSIEIAKSLIDVAADSGADYVKFQSFKAESVVSKKAKKAQYHPFFFV